MSGNVMMTDALLCLRQSIAAGKSPLPTTTADPTSAADAQPNLALATHLQFNHNTHQTFPLDTSTRFESSGKALNLRSIYFAWERKEDAITEYIAATQRLNDDLAGPNGAGSTVQNLVFAERIDLLTWLEGQSEESEHIKPLAADEAAAAQASEAASIAAGISGGVAPIPSGAPGARAGKTVDPRLKEIYNGERRIGDRNTVLRGIKPTDFSHVRKYAEAFLGRNRKQPGRPQSIAPGGILQNPALVPNRPKTGRRPEPIILLSPSASSLLRMSNIKSFLDSGVYTPPDSTSSNANLLHISRLIPSIDPQRPLRFILVDTPEQFKPDYWTRLAAVFTTGQTWQFKSYKWQSPPDLFSHALGIYVGWRGEDVPSAVKGWGRGVITTQLDKWHGNQGSQGRWRDRETVEGIWTAIEESMKSKGWNKDGTITGR